MSLQEAVESAADPTFAVGPRGYITSWNRAAETVFGVSRMEAVWAPCHQVVRAAGVCRPGCPYLSAALEGRAPAAVETKIAGRTFSQHHLGVGDRLGIRQVLHVAHPLPAGNEGTCPALRGPTVPAAARLR